MRLNKTIREHILKKVTDRKLKPLDAQLDPEGVGDALSLALYDPEPEHVPFKLSDWAESISAVRVYISHNDVDDYGFFMYPSLHKQGGPTRGTYGFILSKPRCLSLKDTRRWDIPHHEALTVPEYRKWFETREEAVKLRREIYEEVWPILLSTTTVKGLLKLWPEVKPYLPPATAKSTALVPVGKVKQINKLLELP